jgi:hypothetical protein
METTNYMLVSGDGEYRQESFWCQACLDANFAVIAKGDEETVSPSDCDCERCGKEVK